jgi:hypothetical protein
MAQTLFTVSCTAAQDEDICVALGNIANGGVLKGWEVDVADPEGNIAGCTIWVASPTTGRIATGHIDHQRWGIFQTWCTAVFGNPDLLKAEARVTLTVVG